MKRLFTALLTFTIGASLAAQDLSVADAVSKMKASATAYLTAGFQADDKTGEFQFVDVRIKKVYDFRDYSYGAMMDDFKQHLASQIPYKTLSDGTKVEAYRSQRIKDKNEAMLE